jgi:succinoglycan biosynthesis transport protein ExoP
MLSGAQALQEFVGFVRRQLPVIVFVTVLATALGLLYIVTARPSYTAVTQLIIDAHKLQVFQKESILGDLPIDNAQVESQIEILKSKNIAQSVIKTLQLTEDSEFVGSGGGLLGAMFGFVFSPFEADQATSDFELNRQAMRTFQNRLSVKREGLSYVIQIGFQSYDANRAAQIANAVADAYIVDQLDAKYQATKRASVWLQDRLNELRDQVSSAERAVVDFKTKHNIVSTGGSDHRLLGEQQIAELNSQLVLARAHTAETKARLDRIEKVLKADSPNATVDETVADTLNSEVVTKLRSHYLDLAAREADWSARYGYDHLAAVNLRNQMRELRKSIFEELKRLGESYKSDYEIAKQREEDVQKDLRHAVGQSQTTNTAQIALGELQSTAQTYKTIYDNFLQRYTESVQQQSFPITEARIISTASRPLQKSHPRTLLVLVVASFGGMVLGFGIGLLRDLSDRVFRTSQQVENLLQADCIAMVPLSTGEEPSEKRIVPSPAKPNLGGQQKGWTIANALFSRQVEAIRSFPLVSDLHGSIRATKGKFDAFASSLVNEETDKPKSPDVAAKYANSRTIVHSDTSFWPVVDAPLSRFTEAIRSLKLAVDLNGVVKANQAIGITSALPNEGKSTIAIALAQLMAQVGRRTVLVDCDLRNPSVSRMLAPNAKAGILEVILGKLPLEEVIWTDPSTKLQLLPAVVRSRLAHSNEILQSGPTRKLFEQIRGQYDCLIVDFPPLAPIVDVRAVSTLVDSFIFVIEWGRTKTDVVAHALEHAPDVYDNLLGVALNKVDMNLFRRFANYHESYYYNKQYAKYGYTE